MSKIETTRTGERIEVLHYRSAGAVPPRPAELGKGFGWPGTADEALAAMLKELKEGRH